MAAPKYGPNKTLAAENQFTFKCPVFDATTRIAACFELREIFAVGKRPEVRRGCQAALECGKCPLDRILLKMRGSHNADADPYHAVDTTLRTLNDDILDHIAPILFREEVMKQYDLSPAELTKMRSCNANATPVGSKRRLTPKKMAQSIAEPIEEVVKKVAPKDSGAIAAAVSGDMAAAINKEVGA